MAVIKEYFVWNINIRLFHWLNFIFFIFLLFTGYATNNSRSFGFSLLGLYFLKTIHVYAGYLLIANLLWRILYAFIGSHYSRWRQIIPFLRGYGKAVSQYVRGIMAGDAPKYLGHNPLGRLAVAAMFFLLVTQSVSGLILAGTDVYMPPFGRAVVEHIAAPGVDPSEVKPRAPGWMSPAIHNEVMAKVDPKRYQEIGAIRTPAANIHIWGFYFLAALACLHIVAVFMTEIIEGGNIVSAMITGRKSWSSQPVDLVETESGPDKISRRKP